MYNNSRCKINDKMNIVKTILLKWKESIVLTDENKEKLFQCIATVIDVDCKSNKPVKFTTPTLVKRAIDFSPNSVYTLYMKTCDEVFKFISMLLNEDKSKVALAFVETYAYGFLNLRDYDFSVSVEKWLKNIAIDVVKNIRDKSIK